MKVDDLLEHLSSVGRSGKGWMARCPAHEDRHPSLSIDEGEGGRVLLHCFAGCSIDSICYALGLEVRDLSGDSSICTLRSVLGRGLLSSRSKQPYPSADAAITGALNATRRHDVASNWKVARQYPYSRADGTEHMRVLRFETEDGKRKTFRPIHQAGDAWFIADPPGLLPLYGLQDLGSAPRIFVCEGEKAVDCAREIGLVATTSAHGAKSALRTDWAPLAGREVIILPDNDDAGREYATDVARCLTELDPPAFVRVVPLPCPPPRIAHAS